MYRRWPVDFSQCFLILLVDFAVNALAHFYFLIDVEVADFSSDEYEDDCDSHEDDCGVRVRVADSHTRGHDDVRGLTKKGRMSA